MEARRLRADLFLPLFDLPWFDPTKATAPDLDQAGDARPDVPAARWSTTSSAACSCSDDEPTTDQRAGALLQKFIGQLLTVNA